MGPSLRPKHRTFDVWPLRIPPRFRAPAFPADRLAHRFGIDERLSDCRCHLGGDEHRRIRQIFRQIVELAKAAIHLRTVIVTAAVHRGFALQLAPRRLTFRHWAGVSPYTSACALAETCVFGKQSLEPVSCDPLALSCITQEKATRAPLLPKVRG